MKLSILLSGVVAILGAVSTTSAIAHYDSANVSTFGPEDPHCRVFAEPSPDISPLTAHRGP